MMKVNRGRKSISAEGLVKKHVWVLQYLSNGGTIVDKKRCYNKAQTMKSWCDDELFLLRMTPNV